MNKQRQLKDKLLISRSALEYIAIVASTIGCSKQLYEELRGLVLAEDVEDIDTLDYQALLQAKDAIAQYHNMVIEEDEPIQKPTSLLTRLRASWDNFWSNVEETTK